MTVPTFVVAGTGRSGTTSITETLRAHPDVFVTQPKEPHYLAYAGAPVNFTGPGDRATINQVAITDRERYLALYPADHDYLALGEGSVSTLYHHTEAVPRLAELNPEARVLIVLREPVHRAFSAYQYLRARGFEPSDDFASALRDEPRRIADGWQHLWHYAAMSRYADAVEHVVDTFGPDRVRVWCYEQIGTEGFAERLYRFVGVDPQRVSAADVPRVNVSGEPRSRRLQTLIQAAGRSTALRRLLKAVVPFGVRESIRKANLSRNGVDPRLVAELAPRFADDLAKLRKVVDRLPERPRADWLDG